MKITLTNDNLNLIANTEGAYIENFSCDGKDVFFPKFETEIKGKKKTRGGCHPCLPSFGPSEINDLKDHGYGRDYEWEIAEKSSSKLVLKLEGKCGYEGMDSFISYELLEDGLFAEIEMLNKSEKDLPVAPGFHPYFKVGNDFDVDGLDFGDFNLEDTYFLDASEVSFKGEAYKIKITSQNFHKFAIWTDFLDDYRCVEPCYNGKSFVKGGNPKILKAGETFISRMIVEIIDKDHL